MDKQREKKNRENEGKISFTTEISYYLCITFLSASNIVLNNEGHKRTNWSTQNKLHRHKKVYLNEKKL